MHAAAEASDPGTDPSSTGMDVIIASLAHGTGASDAASGAASAAASGATCWSAVTSGVPESVGLLPPLVLPPQPDATQATVAAAVAKPKIH